MLLTQAVRSKDQPHCCTFQGCDKRRPMAALGDQGHRPFPIGPFKLNIQSTHSHINTKIKRMETQHPVTSGSNLS